MQEISVQELAEMEKQSKVDLIDVRTPAEYREVHATPARNVPLESLEPRAVLAQLDGDSRAPLYVICKSGNRSSQACQKFLNVGFEQVVNVSGGTTAWEKAGLPVVRGKKAFALDRQVQITAGSLALLGAILGFFVHPGFIGLSGFVGAGLIFAGISNLCPMATMIARMPWNQVDGADAGTGATCCR